MAIKDYGEKIKLDPTNPDGYNNRAGLYISLGEYELALDDINKAISLDNEAALMYITKGWLYEELED
ncbi:tetratricopeptide repeat protein, partial [Candidatus Villigracilis affinis]|uniref:tetratricopeptide repeat protein n=1 Tax=Candidatus Villigracilis affinis TaxID=3140682 RepID=UPI001DE6C91D|nr:tetratricopeptide repeat protein [Anaerolineales bacterium]